MTPRSEKMSITFEWLCGKWAYRAFFRLELYQSETIALPYLDGGPSGKHQVLYTLGYVCSDVVSWGSENHVNQMARLTDLELNEVKPQWT